MKYLRLIFKVFLIPAGIFAIILILFLLIMTIKDYTPPKSQAVEIKGNPNLKADTAKLVLLSWNIGYCGLGKDMDFFYEGGKKMRPTEEQYRSYREGMIYRLTTQNNPDFILIQEADQDSHRSYNDNQVERIGASFPNYARMYATNYKVLFVPLPLLDPMGKVNSGLITLSKFRPDEALQVEYPSSYPWPKKLFMLDRCFLLTRFTAMNGKQLVLINTHNSAFDDAADMRQQELDLLKTVIESEYAKGNYVIAGGDWNQNPLPFNTATIKDGNVVKSISPPIPDTFLPEGWHWAFDPNYPTNRDVNESFTKGKTPTTIIDFFIVSPNIEVKNVTTLSIDFDVADHQPVRMVVELKN
jgi:endonuclease/exonuclease/phosphatase family metal-dependent hydrolase